MKKIVTCLLMFVFVASVTGAPLTWEEWKEKGNTDPGKARMPGASQMQESEVKAKCVNWSMPEPSTLTKEQLGKAVNIYKRAASLTWDEKRKKAGSVTKATMMLEYQAAKMDTKSEIESKIQEIKDFRKGKVGVHDEGSEIAEAVLLAHYRNPREMWSQEKIDTVTRNYLGRQWRARPNSVGWVLKMKPSRPAVKEAMTTTIKSVPSNNADKWVHLGKNIDAYALCIAWGEITPSKAMQQLTRFKLRVKMHLKQNQADWEQEKIDDYNQIITDVEELVSDVKKNEEYLK